MTVAIPRISSFITCLAFLSLPAGAALAQSTGDSAGRGSIAGRSEDLFDASTTSRGVFALPLGVAVPQEEGGPLWNPFPTYSADAGLTEWGLGWAAQLIVKRWAPAGEITTATEQLVGPWGTMGRGDDGAYYSDGFSSFVRLESAGNDLVVLTPEGLRATFSSATQQAFSDSVEWRLTQVEDVLGRTTQLRYVDSSAAGNFSLLSSVSYGGVRGSAHPYEVKFHYEPISAGFGAFLTSYERGIARSRQLRVSLVQMFSHEKLRWSYAFTYELNPTVPALYYLSTVRRTFASGASEPAMRFTYDVAGQALDAVEYVAPPAYPEIKDAGAFWTGSGLVDLDGDGDSDVVAMKNEQTTDEEWSAAGKVYAISQPYLPYYDIYRKTNAGLDYQSSWHVAQEERTRFVERQNLYGLVSLFGGPSGSNPRYVAYLINRTLQFDNNNDEDYDLVFSDLYTSEYRLRIEHFKVDDPRSSFMVDIDDDQRSDFISAEFAGGGVRLSVRWNTSTFGSGVSFDPRQEIATLPFSVAQIIPGDVNGDGRTDILLRSRDTATWWALINTASRTFERVFVRFEGESVLQVLGWKSQPLEANADGLMDLYFEGVGGNGLFVNVGMREGALCFRRKTGVEISRLLPMPMRFATSLSGDVGGDGESWLASATSGGNEGLRLTRPSAGLMTSWSDGRGNTHRATYGRMDAVDGLPHRPVVLRSILSHSTGETDVRTDFEFANPVAHSIAKHLLGYSNVVIRRVNPSNEQLVSRTDIAMRFADEVPHGVLVSRTQSSPSDLTVTKSFTHQTTRMRGRTWWRPASTLERRGDGTGQDALQTRFDRYEENCLVQSTTGVRAPSGSFAGRTRRTSTLAHPSALWQTMRCVEERVTVADLSGETPARSTYTSHTETGLPIDVVEDPDGTPLLVSHTEYNADGTLQSVTAATGEQKRFEYLRPPLASKMTTSEAEVDLSDDDPVTGLLHSVRLNGYRAFYRYDAREHLASTWDSLAGHAGAPLASYTYRFSDETHFAMQQSRALVDAERGLFRTSSAIQTAAGATVSAAVLLPTGWSLADATHRDRAANSSKALRFSRTLPVIDELGWETLDASANVIGMAQKSGRGVARTSSVTLHADNEGIVVRHVIAAEEMGRRNNGRSLLRSTVTENNKFSRVAFTDVFGNTVRTEDEAGVATELEYDALDRLKTVRTPDGTTIRSTYDSHGRVLSHTRLTAGTPTTELVVSFGYDASTGLVRSKELTVNGGVERREFFDYDSSGRMTAHVYAANDSAQIATNKTYLYFYDGRSLGHDQPIASERGFLTGVAGPGYSKTLRHAPDGRLLSSELSVLDQRTISQSAEYFDDGSIRRMLTKTESANESGQSCLAQAELREVVLDASGRPRQLLVNGHLFADLRYDDLGRVDTLAFSDGSLVLPSYDPFTLEKTGFTRRYSDETIESLGMRRNDRGLLQRERHFLGNEDLTRSYEYTNRRHLQRANDASGKRFGFAVDTNSSRLTTLQEDTQSLVASQRGYAQPLSLREPGAQGVTHLRYTFNADGTIAQRTDAAGTIGYFYGPDGQIDHTDTGVHYLYDENGRRLAKYKDEAAGQPPSLQSIHPEERGVSDLLIYGEGWTLSTDGTLQAMNLLGTSLGSMSGGTYRSFATDARGTPLRAQLASSSTPTPGAPALSDIASPFGARARRPAVANTSDFTGAPYDEDLKLVRMGVRDYDPSSGSFVQPDPLYLESPGHCVKSLAGCNLYSYAGNDPVNRIDPSGTDDFNMGPNSVMLYPFTDLDTPTMVFNTDAEDFAIRQSMAVANAFDTGSSGYDSAAASVDAKAQIQKDASAAADTLLAGLAARKPQEISPFDGRGLVEPLFNVSPTTQIVLASATVVAAVAVGVVYAPVIASAAIANPVTAIAGAQIGANILMNVSQSISSAMESAAKGGMERVRSLGRVGETSAGILKNTERIPSASGTAAYRIPDVLDHSGRVLGEVKNVGNLSYTNQLRDFATYSQANGYSFELWVRSTTQLSGPLQQAILDGMIYLRILP